VIFLISLRRIVIYNRNRPVTSSPCPVSLSQSSYNLALYTAANRYYLLWFREKCLITVVNWQAEPLAHLRAVIDESGVSMDIWLTCETEVMGEEPARNVTSSATSPTWFEPILPCLRGENILSKLWYCRNSWVFCIFLFCNHIFCRSKFLSGLSSPAYVSIVYFECSLLQCYYVPLPGTVQRSWVNPRKEFESCGSARFREQK
jgi:hypothetical protein